MTFSKGEIMCNSRGLVEPFSAEAEKLLSGEFLELPKNNVKDRVHISFTCDIDEMSDDAVIRIGHGFEVSSGGWVEITKHRIAAYKFYGWHKPPKSFTLPETDMVMEVSDFLSVVINKDIAGNGLFFIVTTKGGMKRFDIKDGMAGEMGSIFASPLNCEIKNCKLNFVADGYADPIWVFGDSYISLYDPSRWPSYLFRDKYTRILLAGYSGMNTQSGLADFKVAVQRGAPKFCCWFLGMNNGDKDGVLNEGWLAATEEFLAICKEKGITPILATIPSTPAVNNAQKNEWIRNSGHRYVDFNRAVGAHKDVAWYPGMLHTDNVHPAQKGAQALYTQILTDFPEIMQAVR